MQRFVRRACLCGLALWALAVSTSQGCARAVESSPEGDGGSESTSTNAGGSTGGAPPTTTVGGGGTGGVSPDCGNGVIDPGETCDDGNQLNSDSCPDDVTTGGTCQPASCGDGFVWSTDGGMETCDDGNDTLNDDCPDGATGTCVPASCDDGILHDGGTGLETDIDCGGATCGECPSRLLLSEIVVTPTGGEFIEIHNPSAQTVALGSVYLADYGTYYQIAQAGGAPGANDFRVHFPAGAKIGPCARVTVSLESATAFNLEHGINPTYDFDSADAGAPAMLGEIDADAGLTNDGEMLVMFYWNGVDDLVKDIDYLLWGDANDAMDKSGVMAGASTYLDETVPGSQVFTVAPVAGESLARCGGREGAELQTGGNGFSGSDETSEDLDSTFQIDTPTPGQASGCLFETSGVLGTTKENDKLQTINVVTGAVISELTMTMAGVTILGTNGMVRDETSGTVYVVIRDSTIGENRFLATLDTSTGVATQIGQLTDRVASITMDGAGVLYGVTGDGATTPETLYSINTSTAAMTSVATLGAGFDGEMIVFNPTENLFFHWSDTVMESLAPGTFVSTNIIQTGPIDHDIEKLGGAFIPSTGDMLVSDLFDVLWVVNACGAYTQHGTTLESLKGLVVLP